MAVLERTPESHLDCKEINPEYSLEGVEAPIFWPLDAKSQLIGKDPDSGED